MGSAVHAPNPNTASISLAPLIEELKELIQKKGWCWCSSHAPVEPNYIFKITDDVEDEVRRETIGFGISAESELDAAMNALANGGITWEEIGG